MKMAQKKSNEIHFGYIDIEAVKAANVNDFGALEEIEDYYNIIQQRKEKKKKQHKTTKRLMKR